MTIGKIIDYFISFYYQVKDSTIAPHKPFSWALYQTWLLVDEKESEEDKRRVLEPYEGGTQHED